MEEQIKTAPQTDMEVVDIQFRSGQKIYFFDPDGQRFADGDHIIIDTARGEEFGICVGGNHKIPPKNVVAPLRKVLRRATPQDEKTIQENRAKEKRAFEVCQQKIAEHGLDMQLVNAEVAFDGSKILFYFTADERVDFRELVKNLASVFRTRIELRQIGVRDKARMVGGLGICGRPFCCASFLDDFQPVSIKMAKTQNLSLNPTKISGTCGRLMCCLKYEQDAYEDALKRMPKNDSFVQTPDGPGNVCEVNVLRETMKVRLDEKPDSPRCYHNCEVCVLRNGKGSRDGIQVPQERPERYVEERPEEEVPMPLVIADFDPDAPAREERPPRRRNDRRRKGGSRPQQIGEKAPEKAEKLRQTEKKRPEAAKTEDKPRSRRRKSGDRPQEGGSRPQAAKNPPKPAALKPPQKPAGEAQEGAQSRRRPRHRGGRRRSGGSSPASEG